MPREPGWTAQYDSICPRCNRAILARNDRVVRQSGNVIHVGCASGQDDE